jgi:hypothetical protein
MTSAEAKQHILEIRKDRFWLDDATREPSQNPLLGMLRRALNQLATGIFEHAHHYVFELTQNADDNSYPADAEHFLKLVLLEDDPTGTPGSRGCLCVLNDEAGFERAHVESLCDIGNSTKHNREGYIGEKGIGFKSVFLISDRPHIISNGYSFHFRRDDCDAGIGYIVPHWTEKIPSVAEGSRTAILLPLRSTFGVDVARQLADIEPECILFLRRLRRIELVSAKSGLNRAMRKDGEEFASVEVNGQRTTYFAHSKQYPMDGVTEPLREGVTSSWVTVALPLTSLEVTNGRVFAFLPTEARTGFPFLINADFLLPASRERVFDAPEWNKHLVKCGAVTFVEAFDKLRAFAEYRTGAYKFLPTKADLLPGTSLFAPLVEAVQGALMGKECVLTESGDYVLPGKAYFADPLSRRLFSDAPPKLVNFRLIHMDLEGYRKRLEPLGVQNLTISQVLDICADLDWLRDREAEWWETLVDLLARHQVAPAAVASFPLLRCLDGVCRSPSVKSVFIQTEGQPTSVSLRPEWPAAHLFDAEVQKRLQQKPVAWEWLKRVASLRPFSMQAYITGNLLDWMREQTGEQALERLVEATRFIATNLTNPDEHRASLRAKMPWLLADKRVLLPEARVGKELVTPECIEGDSGWNWVFISEQDRQHFWILNDAYLEGQPEISRDSIRKLMVTCGATDFPDPPQLGHANGCVDWSCPRWLRDLTLEQPPQNLEKKISALERWIGRFQPNYFAKFLTLSVREGNAVTGESVLSIALRSRPWLRSTKGLIAPSHSFIDDREIREFLRDSVAYTSSKLPSELLEKIGVHLHLSAKTLLELLRQMRSTGEVNEALVVRIYKRLQTLEFDAGNFRAEPLIFLSRPAAVWKQAERVFWRDSGDVFDEYFGYAELTYGNDELHGFFTDKLRVREEVPEQQLAEVWAQMSGTDAPAPDVVEKRLNMILPKLAVGTDASAPPDWWPPLRQGLKIWTTARRFEVPSNVFAPDDTFAEAVFAKTARIAWVPKSHLTLRLNRLLRSLGCRSLAENLRSRAADAISGPSNEQSRFLTRATRELLICWVCTSDGWRDKRQQLEQLLKSKETEVSQLRVEYWLDGERTAVSSVEADAFWASEDQRLCLRKNATPKAQQSAAATSIAAQLGRTGKQGEDTVYRLLGLDVVDAQREMAERKWELTAEQKSWLHSLGHKPQLVEISTEAANKAREARPPVAQEHTPEGIAPTASASPAVEGPVEEKALSDIQATPPPSIDSRIESDAARPGANETARRKVEGEQGENGETKPQTHSTESEGESGCFLKSPDAEAEFVHVAAHTRSRPRRERQRGEAGERALQQQHPMAGVSHAKKTEIEEMAVQIIKRQFQRNPALRDFKLHDERLRNNGYDLLAIKASEALRIEIKAHFREAKSVFVTQKEWQQSKQRNGLAADDKWELWNVENLAADAGKVRITRYSYLPDEARTRESGYWVDLNACQSEPMQ